MQGARLDARLLAEVAPPSHETVIRVPRRLVAAPEVMAPDVFGRWYDEHLGQDMLRVETLDYYDPDAADFARWTRGEREPDWTARRPWLLRVQADAAAGITRRRVRIVRGPLSDYVRYECQWGYLPLVDHGEEVRILDLTEQPLTLAEVPDFGVFDHRHVVRMRYAASGRFVGASEVTDDAVAFVALRDLLWQWAEPFPIWWARHPEHHRSDAYPA